MGPILIIIAVLLVIAKHDKTKKRRKRTLWGKSDWEKTCDDGGKFFWLVIMHQNILLVYFKAFFLTNFLQGRIKISIFAVEYLALQ